MVATTRGQRRGSQDVPFHIIFKSAVGLALVALVAIGVLDAVTDYRASDLFQVIVILIGAAAGCLVEGFYINYILFPTNEGHFFISIAVLMTVYLVLGYTIQIFTTRTWPDPASIMPRVFDAGTFAGSLLLLIGIFVPSVLEAIGSVKPFLLIAAFAGIIYAIHAPKPRSP